MSIDTANADYIMPKRIQRRRTNGHKTTGLAKYVGRPGKWGNPFPTVGEFRRWLNGEPEYQRPELTERRAIILRDMHELRGLDLSCWCSEWVECHADVLIKRANTVRANEAT